MRPVIAEAAPRAVPTGTAERGPDASRATPRPESPRPAADPERVVEIFRQLKLSLTPGTRHAVIQLAPEELGRIAIRVSVRDGRVVGDVRAENPETLELLERHVPELRAALAATGFEASEFEFARHGDTSPRRDTTALPLSETEGRRTSDDVAPASAGAVHEGLLDTYA